MNTPDPRRALLFDLDGTLVDSVADLTVSANHTRAHFGLPALSEEMIAGFVGDGARKLLVRTLREAGSELPVDEALRVFREHYLEHCLDRTKPFAGIAELLSRLTPRQLAIVSNKPQPMCDRIAEGLGWRERFSVIVGARPGLPVKPDPALLVLACEAMGLPPFSEVWMVGDSLNDVRAGRALGATTVAVGYGLTASKTLQGSEPDHYVDSVAELAELLQAT